VESQGLCPVTKLPLGSMGTPIQVDVNGTAVFICCEGCRESLLEEPDKYLTKLAERPTAEDSPMNVARADVPQMDLPPIGAMQMLEPQLELPQMQAPQANADEADAIAKALARLSSMDRTLAERQKVCPVTGMPLGSMGTPVKVSVNGRPVFICCEGCRERLLTEPVKFLARLSPEAVR
jgi:Cu(I)/Ag(I) efflux system membrane fusion protein